jgi:thioredoxin reductase
MTGPKYARHWRKRALRAGAEVIESAMATDWADERTLWVTSPEGRYRLSADAIVLATGARERPRPARRIPGDRPAGVLTTGQLQNLVHVHHQQVGRRAVVVGAELVSWSAVLTLREAGCRTAAMTTRYEKSESYVAFRFAGRLALRTPVRTRTEVVLIEGRERVEAVVVRDLDSGQESRIECDTVVMTGDWIPDNELARSAGIELDPSTLGPAVDSALRTDAPGVFAVGNVLHPVDTADVASLDGTHVVPAVVDWLEKGTTRGGTHVTTDASLRWVTPQYVVPEGAAPARHRLLAWCDEFVTFPVIEVRQDGAVVSSHRLPWPAAPGRVLRIPAGILHDVDGARGAVEIGLRGRSGH